MSVCAYQPEDGLIADMRAGESYDCYSWLLLGLHYYTGLALEMG